MQWSKNLHVDTGIQQKGCTFTSTYVLQCSTYRFLQIPHVTDARKAHYPLKDKNCQGKTTMFQAASVCNHTDNGAAPTPITHCMDRTTQGHSFDRRVDCTECHTVWETSFISTRLESSAVLI
jgi:hypothetical protein